MKLLHTSDMILDMKVFWTLSSSWMSLIFDCTSVLNFHTVIDLSLILDTVVNKTFHKVLVAFSNMVIMCLLYESDLTIM